MLNVGSAAQASIVIGAADLAIVLSQTAADAFPPVFATARMIGLMELAASRVMHSILGEDEVSVGVSINVTHDAPTPIGTEVTATATFVGLEGKLYRFDVVAEDAGGKIGGGSHLRAVVSQARIVQGAMRRNAPSAL